MKYLDKFLQNWRTSKALKHISPQSTVLDIGCYDAIVFEKMGKNLKFGIGIDPLIEPLQNSDYQLVKGWFPNDLPKQSQTFDAITLLAVLEHIPDDKMQHFANSCCHALNKNGKLIITVPHKNVDKILDILIFFKIIDGMSLEEHHGFDVKNTKSIFENNGFELIHNSTFQLGLNNLFVFKKK